MTAYTTIYNSFLDKVNDYDLADMTAELAQTSMRGWLNQAVVRFLESCKKDLTQTEEGGFTEDLDLMEIDILTEGMVEAWLKPIRNNLDLLRNALSTKDFTTFSPANLLDKVNDTYSMAHANFLSRIKEYSFIRNDVGDLI
jgi:hypothetical protein